MSLGRIHDCSGFAFVSVLLSSFFFGGGIKFSVYMFNDNLKIKITYRSPLI